MLPPKLPATKAFRVPDTRLPFVNGVIAQVQLQNQPHLVSAVWGDTAVGRLYFWNPVTESQAMRMLPNRVPGAYMLETGPDGRLYIGCGNGDLQRYDPATDTIESLVTGELSGITWGGCVTDRYVVWTANPGDACVYDWHEGKVVKKFAPVDSLKPHAHYGHHVLEAPDGRVVLFMDTPQLHLCILDLKDLSVRSVMPVSLKGAKGALHAAFFDAHTLMIVASKTRFFSWPDLKLIESPLLSKDSISTYGHGTKMGEYFYAICGPPKASLWRISNQNRRWERLIEGWLGEDTGYLGAFEGKRVCAVTVDGRALSWDAVSGNTDSMQLDNIGQMDPHAACVGAERNLIVGAPFINAQFWTIDMATGKGKNQGRGMPGGGQINQIVWDAGRHRALMSAYTEAAVTEYDPDKPSHWPVNPRLVASAHDEHQMRPLALVFDRRYVWMATSPLYGLLGGALSRIDPETNQIKVWRNIVPDQTINALALDLDKHRIYLSSQIWADMKSAPPTQTTAQILAFDMIKLNVVRRRIVREGAPAVGVTCVMPDGRVLLHEGNQFYAWDADADELQPLGELSGYGPVIADKNRVMWASLGGAIGRLEVGRKTIEFHPIMKHSGGFLQIDNDTLYYACDTTIYGTPLDELRKRAHA